MITETKYVIPLTMTNSQAYSLLHAIKDRLERGIAVLDEGFDVGRDVTMLRYLENHLKQQCQRIIQNDEQNMVREGAVDED